MRGSQGCQRVGMELINFVLRDRYQFVAELGKGGMGAVYFAKDLNLDSYWAVKQVKNTSNIEFESFKKEVELLASLSHPDIPRIVDRIELNDDYFVVMDFIDGTSLARVLNMEGPQPAELVIEWGKMLCDVLEYLHAARENPIVYRDMKPDNVMLTPSGRVKLIDFGIAQEFKRGEKYVGESLGTKGYAAPEQYKGASNLLDERTDIYSLGATLFFLVTGVTPEKPPKGVPPLRQVLPNAPEGLEYVIAKATEDNPENRYQSAEEMRADLDNIEHLTTEYRSKMGKKLASFVLSLAFCIIFAVTGFVGQQITAADREDEYQTAFQIAMEHETKEEYSQAAEYYAQAIEAKPHEAETYMFYFNAMLPQGGGEAAVQQTRTAIDEMRRRYVENQQSPMYHNVHLMYQLARRCIEVEDPAYARYALQYIDLIYQSPEYQKQGLYAQELQSYEVIATYLAQDTSAGDFSALQSSLQSLEAFADKTSLSPDERLNNYYILIKVYSIYPNGLENAYERAYEIGSKAREVLLANRTDEDLAFNNMIPLYELVASGQYISANYYSQPEQKEEAYRRCLEWFGYLNEMSVPFSEALAMREANAHKAIFDLYNTPSRLEKMTDEVRDHLYKAIDLYKRVIAANETAMLPRIYLVSAYLDAELIKDPSARNFSNVLQEYRALKTLWQAQKDASQTEVMQYNALLEKLRTAGLEV